MATTPTQLIARAFWPLAVWPSIFNLEKHPADDYAERTFPLIATAVAFWVCMALLVYVLMQGGTVFNISDGESAAVNARYIPSWIESVSGVLWFFLPALYLIGLWLYSARDEAFPG